jgi:poly-gamma-glutamate capsule biosynthesis protein CapA/YwtB (metallophosphatase superfamily)
MKKKRKMKKIIWIPIILGVIIFSLYYIFAVTNLDSPKEESENEDIWVDKEYNLSLIMAGDALIHSSVYRDAHIGDNKYDFSKMFTYIKPIIKEYDLAFYNQETIIGGKDLGLSTYPRFNSPDEIGDAMVDMGFNLIALANNHTLDRGTKAIDYSLEYWRKKEIEKDVMVAGSYGSFEERDKEKIKNKNNISYTLLAYTMWTNGLTPPKGQEYVISIYDKEQVKKDIERVRDKVDIIMVSMHWGNEYTHKPTSIQKEVAQYLASLGVDIIIGHHPHVVQPIEFIDDTLVIYSLGNFISAQNRLPRLIGMLASVNIKKKVTEYDTHITLENVKADLIYTYYNNFRDFKVIPFTKLTSKYLSNYDQHYNTYSKIIMDIDDSIMVTKIE